MKLIKNIIVDQLAIFSSTCFDRVSEGYFSDADCLQVALAKVLGYAIVLGAAFVKVPQLINIMTKGVAGLSTLMFTLEITGYAIIVAHSVQHGFTFSGFGEAFFVLMQDFVIVFLIVMNSKKLLDFLQFTSCIVVLGLLSAGVKRNYQSGEIILDHGLMEYLRALCIVIFSASRVPQIVTNFANRSTGSLAFVTQLMQFAGSSGTSPL